MKNFVQPGKNLTIPAPYAVASGALVIAGSIVGVASGDAAITEDVVVSTEGVFVLPKVAGAITLGQVVYADEDNLITTAADSGGESPTPYTRVGIAVEAAAAGAIDVPVKLG